MVAFPDLKTEYTTSDLEVVDELNATLARKNFLKFRNFIRPNLLDAWWQRDVAKHLTRFWLDMQAGKRPALVLQAPPQHGKTEQITDFIAFCAGQNPDLKTIFASYSDELGTGVNSSLQRIMLGERYKLTFPMTRLASSATVLDSARWKRHSTLLEYVHRRGSFRNTTVGGPINGQGLDLGVVDDPIKGRAEAQSKLIRDKTWSWFTDDFFGRFSNHAGFLMIMTRWHMEDPAGQWLEHFPDTRVLRYPAIAEQDEKHRKQGEPLFPQLKSLEFLDMRRRTLTQASWESIYQQKPIAAGGDMFPIERFNVVASFDRSKVRRSIRYVDKAGTKDGGAYTAAALVHDMKDGTTVVDDVIRGQWGALEREQRVMQAAVRDREACGGRYQLWFEQEPGSGGKESAEESLRRFRGFQVFADKVTGDKEVRAEPYAAQVQAGQVYIKAAEWNGPFFDEHETFPNGKFMDQVDATAGAFNKLAAALGTYDRSLDWVG